MKLNFPLLNKKTKKIVGLDIGSYNLKVVEMNMSGNVRQITALAMKDIRSIQDLSGIIEETFTENNITTTDVNIAISGESVVARHLSLPKMSEDELKKAIIFELEDHIPFKPEEVYLDFRIVGDELNSENKMRVVLVAAKKDFLDFRIELVRKAGLEPRLVTMDALSLMNTLYFNYPNKEKTNVALLNIGDKITNLVIAREKIPYFIRDTRFGGESITALLQTKMELDKKAAEELKHNLKDASSDVPKLIKTTLASLLNEIFVSIDFFENLTEKKIDEIYLSGGSSQLFGLKEFLGGYLSLEILTLDPLKNFTFSPSISQETISKVSPYMAVATGLALEDL